MAGIFNSGHLSFYSLFVIYFLLGNYNINIEIKFCIVGYKS